MNSTSSLLCQKLKKKPCAQRTVKVHGALVCRRRFCQRSWHREMNVIMMGRGRKKKKTRIRDADHVFGAAIAHLIIFIPSRILNPITHSSSSFSSSFIFLATAQQRVFPSYKDTNYKRRSSNRRTQRRRESCVYPHDVRTKKKKNTRKTTLSATKRIYRVLNY